MDVNEMSEEQLESLGEDEASQLDTIANQNTGEEETKTAQKPEEKPDPEKSEAETPESEDEPEPKAEDSQTTEDPEGEEQKELTSEQVLEKRAKDARQAMMEAQTERNNLKRENEKLKSDMIKAKLGHFQELTPDELEILKDEDVDKYIEYKKSKDEHDAKLSEHEQSLASQSEDWQWDEVLNFLKSEFEFDAEKAVRDNPEEAQKTWQNLINDKFEPIKKELMDNCKPDEYGVYTAKQMSMAYQTIFKDQIKQELTLNARRDALETIKKTANSGGSKFDNINRINKPGQQAQIQDLTQDDIEAMGEDELKALEADLKV